MIQNQSEIKNWLFFYCLKNSIGNKVYGLKCVKNDETFTLSESEKHRRKKQQFNCQRQKTSKFFKVLVS